ncbi:hypothetical protein [Nostoc sp.]|uniref:hypothetical protein n=1 Tax=Nostoc sp. TaxID=1180 RepID=UPI002FF92631
MFSNKIAIALSPLHASGRWVFKRWLENPNLCKAVLSVFSLQKNSAFCFNLVKFLVIQVV